MQNDEESSITLIMGPMFSGKTTELINIYKQKSIEFGKSKCICLNYALDKRYGDNKIISHNGLSIDCLNIYNINDFIVNNVYTSSFIEAKYIFINEAQFFNDLIENILYIKNIHKKHIILCGLDLDFQCKQFGQLLDLTIYSNKVIYLHGKCNTIGCNYPSRYSHRVVQNKDQVLIGSHEYVPLCKDCYDKNNT